MQMVSFPFLLMQHSELAVDMVMFHLDASSRLKFQTVQLGPHASGRETNGAKYHLLHSNSAISFSIPLADTLLRRGSPVDGMDKEEPAPRLALTAEATVGVINCSEKIAGLKIVSLSGIAYGAWWSDSEVGVSMFRTIHPSIHEH